MKADKNYTSIRICPTTKERLHTEECHGHDAVCPRCGHVDTCSICHYEIVVVRFVRPSFYERFIMGKKTEVINKVDEDKVWNGLQQ